jgi:quercetin dioxygenase-like cupin family protein
MLYSIQEGILGGFFIRLNGPFMPGEKSLGHEHHIDHLTYISNGSVRIVYGEDEDVVRAGRFVLMKANVRHEFWALEPNTSWYCLFSEAEAMKLIDQGDLVLSDVKQNYARAKDA